MFWRTWILKPATRHNRRNQDWESWTAERGPTLLEIDPSGGLFNLAKMFADERIAEAMQRRAEAMRYQLDPQDEAR